eukprot:Tamp_10203.p5 GENE.Tamp_10203~~Tamp_10203.p5  ORF type:complete len:135 (+),score=21.57 Tamp_10203:471-875(+)
MPWPLTWFRRKVAATKRPAQLCAPSDVQDLETIRAEQGSIRMPGVGNIDLDSTRKTKHAASVAYDEFGEPVHPPSVNGLQRSLVCPKAALTRNNSALSITELRLGPNKAPCCIILTEDIEAYTPPKLCPSSNRD